MRRVFHHRRRRDAHRDIAGFHDQPADDSRPIPGAAAGDDRDPTRKALVSRAPVGFRHRPRGRGLVAYVIICIMIFELTITNRMVAAGIDALCGFMGCERYQGDGRPLRLGNLLGHGSGCRVKFGSSLIG